VQIHVTVDVENPELLRTKYKGKTNSKTK